MAAPGDFGAAPASAPRDEARLALDAAMPFERPGMSFPGSAFYYLADSPSEALIALPATDPLDGSTDAVGYALGERIESGPAARAFALAGSGASRARAQQCLAQAVWYEAASESEAGQRAVAQVVLNRVAHPSWPSSVCGVVYQGSNRSTGCQFTFTCDGSLARRAGGASWARAQRIAAAALAGEVYAPVGHATHYHTLWVNPRWAGSLDHIGTIGAHRFYRNRGAGGSLGAFTVTYAGFEPGVPARAPAALAIDETAPARATANPPGLAPVNPVPIGAAPRAPTPPAPAAPVSSVATTPPVNPAWSGAGQVKQPYAKAGQWKADPKSLDLSVPPSRPATGQ
ncbi:cell wall hydrolase [Erythrobacter sp. JK5]|nr:cell wall hydrolase [Erythrobacter sp. JK5]